MTEPALKNVLVLDGADATEIIGTLSLILQHPSDHASHNPYADSCEPIARKHRLSHRERIRPLQRSPRKDWDGIDVPSYKSTRQLSEEEAADGPEELAERAIIRHPALRTRDNIQLYCFRDRYPYAQGQEDADPTAQDPNHLDYWLRRMEEQFKPGEQLDAVIIPSVKGPLKESLLRPFITKVREQWPQALIIQNAATRMPSNPLSDHYFVGLKAGAFGDEMRTLLDVPLLSKPTREDVANLAAEQRRESLLARGYTPDKLPAALKRKGDPGYKPPGDGGTPGRG